MGVGWFTRLAFKAQAQCRATIETLALLKNPSPAVFARQANIAHGPQQVNNAGPQARPESQASRAENQESDQIKLLEAPDERLDLATTKATGEGHQAMATVGKIDRTSD